MSTTYYIVDTETASMKVEDGVVEVAWVELDGGANIIDQRQALIDPGSGYISPSAEGVHGISLDMVADAPTLDEFFTLDTPPCYGRKLGNGGPVVWVGHRCDFDIPYLAPYVNGEIIPLDTLRLARAMWPESEDHKLSTLKCALGLRKNAGDAHRALADVLVTYDLLKLCMQMLGETLDSLAQRCQQPFPLRVMPFGKYKGQHPREVPKSYWTWALNNLESMDRDLRHTAEAYLNK